jgi:hypothetical protein
MEDMSYLTFRLKCSHEEKIECLQTVRKLSRILNIARADGFLALEPFAEQEADSFLKACLLDVLDGLDGDGLKELFCGYLAAGDYSGKEFLNAILISEGLLCLQSCQSPENLWYSLKGFFGTDFAEEYREAFHLEREDGYRRGKALQSCLPTFDGLISLSSSLRDRLLRETPARELAVSLKGAGEPVRCFLWEGLSPQSADRLTEEMDSLTLLRSKDVMEAQKHLMERVEAWKGEW